MLRIASAAVLLPTFFRVSLVAADPPARTGRIDVRLFELASVRRLFHTLARNGEGMKEGERAAALADFSVMSEAVVGGSAGGPYSFEDLVRLAAAGGAAGPQISATHGVSQRDEAAYRLLALGYSARETADVVGGRISQQALDTAQRMIAVGKGRDAAADYLDTQYRLVVAARSPSRPPYRDNRSLSSRAFDGFIEHYAR